MQDLIDLHRRRSSKDNDSYNNVMATVVTIHHRRKRSVSDDNDLSSMCGRGGSATVAALQQLQPFFVRRCAVDILKPQLLATQ